MFVAQVRCSRFHHPINYLCMCSCHRRHMSIQSPSALITCSKIPYAWTPVKDYLVYSSLDLSSIYCTCFNATYQILFVKLVEQFDIKVKYYNTCFKIYLSYTSIHCNMLQKFIKFSKQRNVV